MKKEAPEYLEAGLMGRPLHEKMGSHQVRELMELDLRPSSGETTFFMAKLPLHPKQRR